MSSYAVTIKAAPYSIHDTEHIISLGGASPDGSKGVIVSSSTLDSRSSASGLGAFVKRHRHTDSCEPECSAAGFQHLEPPKQIACDQVRCAQMCAGTSLRELLHLRRLYCLACPPGPGANGAVLRLGFDKDPALVMMLWVLGSRARVSDLSGEHLVG